VDDAVVVGVLETVVASVLVAVLVTVVATELVTVLVTVLTAVVVMVLVPVVVADVELVKVYVGVDVADVDTVLCTVVVTDVDAVEVNVVDGVVYTHPRSSPLLSALMAVFRPFTIFSHELGSLTRRNPAPAQPIVCALEKMKSGKMLFKSVVKELHFPDPTVSSPSTGESLQVTVGELASPAVHRSTKLFSSCA